MRQSVHGKLVIAFFYTYIYIYIICVHNVQWYWTFQWPLLWVRLYWDHFPFCYSTFKLTSLSKFFDIIDSSCFIICLEFDVDFPCYSQWISTLRCKWLHLRTFIKVWWWKYAYCGSILLVLTYAHDFGKTYIDFLKHYVCIVNLGSRL